MAALLLKGHSAYEGMGMFVRCATGDESTALDDDLHHDTPRLLRLGLAFHLLPFLVFCFSTAEPLAYGLYTGNAILERHGVVLLFFPFLSVNLHPGLSHTLSSMSSAHSLAHKPVLIF